MSFLSMSSMQMSMEIAASTKCMSNLSHMSHTRKVMVTVLRDVFSPIPKRTSVFLFRQCSFLSSECAVGLELRYAAAAGTCGACSNHDAFGALQSCMA